jgi:hypothetical protein
MAVRTGYIDGFALMTGVAGTAHQTDTCMTVGAAHPGQIVGIGWHTLDVPTIGQSQTGILAGLFGNINFRKAGVV